MHLFLFVKVPEKWGRRSGARSRANSLALYSFRQLFESIVTNFAGRPVSSRSVQNRREFKARTKVKEATVIAVGCDGETLGRFYKTLIRWINYMRWQYRLHHEIIFDECYVWKDNVDKPGDRSQACHEFLVASLQAIEGSPIRAYTVVPLPRQRSSNSLNFCSPSTPSISPRHMNILH